MPSNSTSEKNPLYMDHSHATQLRTVQYSIAGARTDFGNAYTFEFVVTQRKIKMFDYRCPHRFNAFEFIVTKLNNVQFRRTIRFLACGTKCPSSCGKNSSNFRKNDHHQTDRPTAQTSRQTTHKCQICSTNFLTTNYSFFLRLLTLKIL